MINAKSIQMQTTNTNANTNDHTISTAGNQNIKGYPSATIALTKILPNTRSKLDYPSSDQHNVNELKTTSIHTIVKDHERRKRRSRLIREINNVVNSDQLVNNMPYAATKLNDDNKNDDDLDTAATYYFRPLFVYRIQEAHRKQHPTDSEEN